MNSLTVGARRPGLGRRTLGIGMVMIAGLVLGACDGFEPEWVDSLILNPDSVHIEPGESAVFTATPYSQRGDELFGRSDRVEFSIPNSPTFQGTAADGSLTVTATQLGSGTFTARLGRGVQQGRVFVQPPGLASIAIVPSSVDLPRGSRPDVRAVLLDAAGNELDPEGFRISWSSLNSQVLFVGTTQGPVSNLFLRQLGSTQLRLTVGDMNTTIPVRSR